MRTCPRASVDGHPTRARPLSFWGVWCSRDTTSYFRSGAPASRSKTKSPEVQKRSPWLRAALERCQGLAPRVERSGLDLFHKRHGERRQVCIAAWEQLGVNLASGPADDDRVHAGLRRDVSALGEGRKETPGQ